MSPVILGHSNYFIIMLYKDYYEDIYFYKPLLLFERSHLTQEVSNSSPLKFSPFNIFTNSQYIQKTNSRKGMIQYNWMMF